MRRNWRSSLVRLRAYFRAAHQGIASPRLRPTCRIVAGQLSWLHGRLEPQCGGERLGDDDGGSRDDRCEKGNNSMGTRTVTETDHLNTQPGHQRGGHSRGKLGQHWGHRAMAGTPPGHKPGHRWPGHPPAHRRARRGLDERKTCRARAPAPFGERAQLRTSITNDTKTEQIVRLGGGVQGPRAHPQLSIATGFEEMARHAAGTDMFKRLAFCSTISCRHEEATVERSSMLTKLVALGGEAGRFGWGEPPKLAANIVPRSERKWRGSGQIRSTFGPCQT